MKAAAVDQKLFDAAVQALPAGGLSPLRNSAAAEFATMDFPSVRDENWKYTNLSGIADISNAWLRDIAKSRFSRPVLPLLTEAHTAVTERIDASWILIRNGIVDSDSLEAAQIHSGIGISRLADDDNADIAVDGAMSAFNAALLQDGLRIRADENSVSGKPIGILFIEDPAQRVSQTRVVIESGANSHIKVVECALSAAGGEQFTNSVTQADLAPGSRLDHVRLQHRSNTHLGTNRLVARLQRDSIFSHNSFDFGGDMTRNDVIAKIAGAGAAVNLHGLYLASGNQHIDNHTRIEHRVGPATSHEEYRGILSGRSRCVFNGQAIVFAGADGTDANQSNHNLLLSRHAEIDTKPELEIYADEVKCGHGATVGQLDESSLFYLRSRGLDPDEARRLLTQAFAAGILSSLAVEECRDYLTGTLGQRLAQLVDDENQ